MTKALVPGQKVLIHAYKHNGGIYRSWDHAIVLEATEDYLILVNEAVIVTEINGRKWRTHEPAIWFFFKNHWYNVISMLKNNGIHYYCNIASPFTYDGKVIKFIDYDIDIKVFPDGFTKVLDLKEFNRNKITYNYPLDLQNIVWNEVQKLKLQIKAKETLFSEKFVWKYWNYYQKNFRKHFFKQKTALK